MISVKVELLKGDCPEKLALALLSAVVKVKSEANCLGLASIFEVTGPADLMTEWEQTGVVRVEDGVVVQAPRRASYVRESGSAGDTIYWVKGPYSEVTVSLR